jgi:hypothetical protein
VKRQPEIAIQTKCYAFANSPQFANGTTLRCREGWLRGSQEKGAGQPYLLQGLADDPRFERADIRGNIGQFWHEYQIARRTGIFATSSTFVLHPSENVD